MSDQLERRRKDIVDLTFLPLDKNGILLHLNGIVDANYVYRVSCYNLAALGHLMRENIDLRKKLEDLVDKYVMHLETSGKPWRCQPHDLSSHYYSHPSYQPNMCEMGQRLEFLEKRFDKLEEIMKEK